MAGSDNQCGGVQQAYRKLYSDNHSWSLIHLTASSPTQTDSKRRKHPRCTTIVPWRAGPSPSGTPETARSSRICGSAGRGWCSQRLLRRYTGRRSRARCRRRRESSCRSTRCEESGCNNSRRSPPYTHRLPPGRTSAAACLHEIPGNKHILMNTNLCCTDRIAVSAVSVPSG